MFRALTFVTVRQQHHQTRHAQPFGFARADELVNDDLCTVGKITELGFPQNQRMRFGKGDAIFEAQNTGFGQGRVEDFKLGLAGTDVVERGVFCLVGLIDQFCVTLREGAALAILTGQTHRCAFAHQGAECEGFTGCPVDAFAGFEHLGLGLELAQDFLVDVIVAGRGRKCPANFLQQVVFHTGLTGPVRIFAVRGGEARPFAFEPVCLVRAIGFGGLEFVVKVVLEFLIQFLDAFFGQKTFLDQLLGVDVLGGRVFADHVIHLGLGEGRFVAFIVAKAAIAEHVDDNVLFEFLTEFGRDACGVNHGFWVVTIDMDDRRLNDLGNIRAVRRRTAIGRLGGETDLVVDDKVDRTAGTIAFEVRQIEGFSDKTLTGKGRIPVKEDTHDLFACGVLALCLFGADLAQNDGVYRFEVGRVRGQRQVNNVTVKFAVSGRPKVIFDVTRAHHVVRLGRVAHEFREDRLERFVEHIGQNVQTTTVRHAEHDLADAKLAAAFEDLFKGRHQGFATVDAETLGADIFGVQIVFETFGFDQTFKDGFLAACGKLCLVADAFDALLNPGFLFGFLDMHEFDADRAAIGFAGQRYDLTNGRGFKAKNIGDVDRTIHVGFGEAIGFRIEFRVWIARGKAQRIKIRFEMAAHAIGADQHQGANRIMCRGTDGVGADRRGLLCGVGRRCVTAIGGTFGVAL